MSQLEDKAERFYKKFHARDPAGAASDFRDAYFALFRNIDNWTANRPQLPEERRTKGRKLFLPSQERSRLLTELKDVADMLDSIAKLRLAGKTKHGRPRERTEISRDACRAILGEASVCKALFAPLRERPSEPSSDEDFKEALIWGHDDWWIDAILIKRASAQMARDRTIIGYGLSAVQRRLFRETAHRLLVASNRCRQNVAILAFVDAMNPAAIRNLAENARQAEKELRVSFGIERLDKDVQGNRTTSDFMAPAPFYTFVGAALEAGWRFDPTAIHVDDRERLLVGENGPECEDQFVELIESARKWAPEIGTEYFKMEDVNVFVGVDLAHILKDLGSLSGKDDYREGALPTATMRICHRVIRQREQIIVLRDHAVTFLRCSEFLRATTPANEVAAEFLLQNAYYRVWDEARECDAQYHTGIFYAPDLRRGVGGTPVPVASLNVELLRRSYSQRYSGGARWAAVTAKEMAALLRCIYHKEDPLLLQVVDLLARSLGTADIADVVERWLYNGTA